MRTCLPHTHTHTHTHTRVCALSLAQRAGSWARNEWFIRLTCALGRTSSRYNKQRTCTRSPCNHLCVCVHVCRTIIQRQDEPSTWDVYTEGGNYTVVLSADRNDGTVNAYDNVTSLIGPFKRSALPPAGPANTPDFSGGFSSTDGGFLTCVGRWVYSRMFAWRSGTVHIAWFLTCVGM